MGAGLETKMGSEQSNWWGPERGLSLYALKHTEWGVITSYTVSKPSFCSCATVSPASAASLEDQGHARSSPCVAAPV